MQQRKIDYKSDGFNQVSNNLSIESVVDENNVMFINVKTNGPR